jgi:hypothetical protein
LVSQRTGIINQIRAFLLERDVAVRQGQLFLRAELPSILTTRSDVLSPRMVRAIGDLAGDWRRFDARIEGLSTEIAGMRAADERAGGGQKQNRDCGPGEADADDRTATGDTEMKPTEQLVRTAEQKAEPDDYNPIRPVLAKDGERPAVPATDHRGRPLIPVCYSEDDWAL